MLDATRNWINRTIDSAFEKSRSSSEIWFVWGLFLAFTIGILSFLIWIIQKLKPLLVWFHKSKFRHYLAILFLLLPPLLLWIGWYVSDRESAYAFPPFELSSQKFKSEDEFKKYLVTSEASNRESQNSYISYELPPQSSQLDFRSSFSAKAAEILGILSLLPTEWVCLANRNKFTYGTITLPPPDTVGAIDVKVLNGPEFYSKAGKEDCHWVSKKRLIAGPTQLTYGYQGMARTSVNGEVDIIQFTLDTSKSSFEIYLSLWTLIPFYVLALSACSLIYFQLGKIYSYVFNNQPSER